MLAASARLGNELPNFIISEMNQAFDSVD